MTSNSPARPGLFLAAAIAIATAVGGVVFLATRPTSPPPAPVAAATTTIAAAATTRPVAVIVDAVRELKLVTFSFDTTVEARSVSDRWYGDAVADVRAPVRYQYGVDLAELEPADVLIDGATAETRYVFLVPPPERIAVEVDIGRLEQTLKTSGVRWRSANQSQLDAAQKRLAERATQMQLSPEDADRLREVSRQQIQTLLGRIVADRTGGLSTIDVRFAR